MVCESLARLWVLPSLLGVWLVLGAALVVSALVLSIRSVPHALVLRAAGELAGDTSLFESMDARRGGVWDPLILEAAQQRSAQPCHEGHAASLPSRLMPLAIILAALFVALPGRVQPRLFVPQEIAVAQAELEAALSKATNELHGSSKTVANHQDPSARLAALQQEIEILERFAGTKDHAAAVQSLEMLASQVAADLSSEDQRDLQSRLTRASNSTSSMNSADVLHDLRRATAAGDGTAAAGALRSMARRLNDLAPLAVALQRHAFVADAARASARVLSTAASTSTVPQDSRVNRHSQRQQSPEITALLEAYFRQPAGR
jgi:hypothetical protein